MEYVDYKMNGSEIVNCYCFNPLCKTSIFSSKKDIAVAKTLFDVLTRQIVCKNCNSELISKPVLQIKIQIVSTLNVGNSGNKIGIDDGEIFILS